ncbi:MAG: hypothetical protein HKN34_12495 [Gammaproteobacteria bacterium]|nr:hypothetical protein [Gammaproteobacteria bacterium]
MSKFLTFYYSLYPEWYKTRTQRDLNCGHAGLIIIWLHKSALQGNLDGQFAFAVMLATAYGEDLDKTSDQQRQEAIIWFTKAINNGHLDAAEYIGILTR